MFYKNSTEFFISHLEQKFEYNNEYINLDLIIPKPETYKEEILESLEPYIEDCYFSLDYSSHWYESYSLDASITIRDILYLLDNFHRSVPGFRYQMNVKPIKKKHPLQIHINRKNKQIVTLSRTCLGLL